MAAPRPKGNTRTDQANRFNVYEISTRNKSAYLSMQSDVEAKEQQAVTPTDGNMDMTNLAQRWGRAVRVADFIRIVKAMNPDLVFELSKNYPDKYGVYTTRWKKEPTTRMLLREKRFVVGMLSELTYSGYMPEFSTIVSVPVESVDPLSPAKASRKFSHEIRGWRTVLAALIMEGLITEAQVEKSFQISRGRDSANWQKKVLNLTNNNE